MTAPGNSIQVVVVTLGCANLHLTEVRLISPVVYADGSVDGSAGSDADFCQVCDNSDMTTMNVELRDVPASTDPHGTGRVAFAPDI